MKTLLFLVLSCGALLGQALSYPSPPEAEYPLGSPYAECDGYSDVMIFDTSSGSGTIPSWHAYYDAIGATISTDPQHIVIVSDDYTVAAESGSKQGVQYRIERYNEGGELRLRLIEIDEDP